jgi:hypothetical protein
MVFLCTFLEERGRGRGGEEEGIWEVEWFHLWENQCEYGTVEGRGALDVDF